MAKSGFESRYSSSRILLCCLLVLGLSTDCSPASKTPSSSSSGQLPAVPEVLSQMSFFSNKQAFTNSSNLDFVPTPCVPRGAGISPFIELSHLKIYWLCSNLFNHLNPLRARAFSTWHNIVSSHLGMKQLESSRCSKTMLHTRMNPNFHILISKFSVIP